METLAKTSRSWGGTALPHYPAQPPEVSVLRIRIPAGAKLSAHKHELINVGYLARGELVVVADSGKKLELKAGDAIVELVDQWHYGYNPGPQEAEIIVFYVGSPNIPLSTPKP